MAAGPRRRRRSTAPLVAVVLALASTMAGSARALEPHGDDLGLDPPAPGTPPSTWGGQSRAQSPSAGRTVTFTITSMSRSSARADLRPPSSPAASLPDAAERAVTPGPKPVAPPPIMTSRLALGLDTGYRAPLGRFGIDAGWYPLRWIGFDVGLGLPVDGPSTTAENVFATWPIYGPLEMGVGVGFAQGFVPGSNGGHSGVVTNLDLEALHLNLFLTHALSLRANLGYALNLGGGDYCAAHPSLCPAVKTLYSTAGLAWNFDLSPGPNP